jgi:hypothetical protein
MGARIHSSSRRNRDPNGSVDDDPLETWRQPAGAYRPGHESACHRNQENDCDAEVDDLRDAGLIASAQKIEHYEIAAYGTAAALAGQLELRDEQKMLHMSLEEERQVDTLLTHLAKREVNRQAVAA